MCNVVAADAWAAAATIFYAATGARLVDNGPRFLTGTTEDWHVARLAHLEHVHAQWKVRRFPHRV